MKKLMKMIIGRAKPAPHWGVQSRFCVIGERAKRARHSQVCSIENRIYTRNVLLSAQMGERASVVLICIITSCFEL